MCLYPQHGEEGRRQEDPRTTRQVSPARKESFGFFRGHCLREIRQRSVDN